ncbi:MAG: SCP2 sterol-binding domain-containing protein [Rhizobacter sp.]|nr:SCP2 sterol-binding domain-containing protein [Rhizobacter sp.]
MSVRLSLPEPVRRFVAALPTEPPSFVLARVLDRVLWPHLDADVRQRLLDRAVELRVEDLGVVARVKVGPAGFRVASGQAAAAVRIGATLDTYLRLARGDDDADRLFFERALLMEGDTETALIIKNTLDAIGPLWR